MTIFTDSIVETTAASDRQGMGNYNMLAPELTFLANKWFFDTATPTLATRAISANNTATITFLVYNVPSITFTVQKDFGWGAATVKVDGVLKGTISSNDPVGGGFLQDITIQTNVSKATAATVVVQASNGAAAPIVITNIKLNVTQESLGASVVTIQQGAVTETATATEVGSSPTPYTSAITETLAATDTSTGFVPANYPVSIVESAWASDRRGMGNYAMLAPELTFTGSWNTDTATPGLVTRKFSGAVGDQVAFDCYNVPSITFTVQKDFGWGAADVFVDNVLVGTITSNDATGGGFLQDVTVYTKIQKDTVANVRVVAKQGAAAPIVLTNIKFDVAQESLGAVWNIVPNNMTITETVTAIETNTGGLLAAAIPVNESVTATDLMYGGTYGRMEEFLTATELTNSVFTQVNIAQANATATIPAFSLYPVAITDTATATDIAGGIRALTPASVIEAADAIFDTRDRSQRAVGEIANLVDVQDAIADFKTAVSESAAATDLSSWTFDKFSNITESAAANATQDYTMVSVMYEVTPASESSIVRGAFKGVTLEVTAALDSPTARASFIVAASALATATETHPVGVDMFASTVASCAAVEQSVGALKNISNILTNANPFFTNIPAVFRVTAVRKVNGVEVESDPTVRVWGRISQVSKDKIIGDAFAPQSARIIPASDMEKILPY